MVDKAKLALVDLMSFDHVIRVDDEGNAHDDVTGVYAPDVYVQYDENGREDIGIEQGWSLLNGYSRQDRYSGPIMHPSELLGNPNASGTLANVILSEPGYYVCVVVYDIDDDSDDNADGWAVARKDTD